MKTPDKTIAIYHRVFPHENFEDTARVLLQLLNKAQSDFPDAPRHLYLEIDGHRNSKGEFDDDMLELQTKFTVEVLIQFLRGANTPLAKVKNQKPQNNNVPSVLNLIKIDPPASSGR
jgi:hypothetical protein